MSFVSRGHTAGEAAIIERLAQSPDAELERGIAGLPETSFQWGPVETRLTGLIVFGPEAGLASASTMLSRVTAE